MELKSLTYLVVGGSFALYIGIAFWSRARDTRDFYIAGKGVNRPDFDDTFRYHLAGDLGQDPSTKKV